MTFFPLPTEESALVLALPNDSAAALGAKVRATGAARVQVLIPDGAQMLQEDGDFTQLRQSLAAAPLELLVISSDERVLAAARRAGFETIGVQGAPVLAPGAATHVDALPSYATRPLADDDVEFLDALERVNVPARYADEQNDVSGAAAPPARPGAGARSTRPLAPAPDDDWDDDSADADTDEDEPPRRPDADRRVGVQRRTAPVATPRREVAHRDRLVRTERALGRAYDDEYTAPRRPSALRVLLPLLIIALLIAVPLAYYFLARATIVVALPPNTASDVPFSGEVIPLTKDAGQPAAIQSVQVSAPATFTLEARAGQTLTPVGVARGTVTIYNALSQTIELPQGSEFLSKNTQGQDVRFLIDAPATIPPAVTSSTIAGTSTTNGRLDVAVSARSPGSASNVGENTVTQLLIPGQQPIGGGGINFTNTPIAGGDEQNVFVVTQESVQNALGEALTQLYKTGIAELGKQMPNDTFEIDPLTLSPDAQQLGDPQSYDPPVVEPAIGQVLDAKTPTFRLTVKATFSALAAPRGQPVSEQLKQVVPAYFQAQPTARCKSGQRQIGFTVTAWRWDGARLTVDGAVTCQTSQQEQEIRSKVVSAVRGQTRPNAEAALRQLQSDGLIASYAILPADRQQIARFDPLIDVRVSGASSSAAPAPGDAAPPAAPAAPAPPTTGAQP